MTVAQLLSQFGQVQIGDNDVVTGFHEVAPVPYWVNCGIYAFSTEGLARFPEKGDHDTRGEKRHDPVSAFQPCRQSQKPANLSRSG